MTTALEPTGRLDAPAVAVANGPEGEPRGWDQVDWAAAEREVRRLRQRIFTASRNGDLKEVRGLQKLRFRSRCNALVRVRRVTEINDGRMTAGIDRKVVLEADDKAELARWVQQRSSSWAPRRVARQFDPPGRGAVCLAVDRDAARSEPGWAPRSEPVITGRWRSSGRVRDFSREVSDLGPVLPRRRAALLASGLGPGGSR